MIRHPITLSIYHNILYRHPNTFCPWISYVLLLINQVGVAMGQVGVLPVESPPVVPTPVIWCGRVCWPNGHFQVRECYDVITPLLHRLQIRYYSSSSIHNLSIECFDYDVILQVRVCIYMCVCMCGVCMCVCVVIIHQSNLFWRDRWPITPFLPSFFCSIRFVHFFFRV